MRVYTALPIPARRRSGRPLNASALGPSTHMLCGRCIILLVTGFAVGCGQSTRQPPSSRAQAEASHPVEWDVAKLADAALNHEQHAADPLHKNVRILRWRVLEDKRLLLLEEAIVSVNMVDHRWRLAHVHRHPEQSPPSIRWRLSSRTDMPFINHRDYKPEPDPHQTQQFVESSLWSEDRSGFRVLASGGA